MPGFLNALFASLAGIVEDIYFNYVTLLLHGDGTNGAQNNTFLDSSTNNFTITRNGNTTQGTFSPFSLTEGQWSNYFGSTTDNLKFASNAAFGVGTNNFTVEFFLNVSSWSGNQRFFIIGQSGTDGISFARPNSDNIAIDIANSRIITYGWTPTVGRWYHLALVRSGTGSNQTTLYIDGVSVATGTSSGSVGQNAAFIGGLDWATSYNTQGYISNLRFSNSARTITVPTTPYTSDANTIILSCQSNRFKDNSANAFAITVNGNTSIQPFSPFAPSAAYSAATNGGSGYFDGSGDYLTVPDNAAYEVGSSDFTEEFWIYPTAASMTGSIIDKRSGAGSYSECPQIQIASNQPIAYVSYSGSSWAVTINGSSNVRPYSWNHIALTRSGSTWTLWLNGASIGSATSSGTVYAGSSSLVIGAASSAGEVPITGYLSSVRIVKGTALYTSAFTPPTAPLTAVANTQLLLNFTNGGIIDNTGRNVLETVGNAQISTSVKKFGTGSMYFDGTGDYLVLPPSPNLAFGTGDFTIEFWLNSSDGNANLIGITTNASGNWNLVLAGSSLYWQNQYSQSNLYNRSATSILDGNWHHIAITRSSGTSRMFFDGVVQGASVSDTTSYVSAHNMQIGSSGVYGDINGYIDDLRITKGIARYTTTFTPPTAAFPDL